MATINQSSCQVNRCKKHQQYRADALTNLQVSDNNENHRYERGFPKDSDYQETKGESGTLSRYSGLDDDEARRAKEAIAERLRSLGVEISDPDSIELGYPDISGPFGHKFEGLALDCYQQKEPVKVDIKN